MQKINKARKLIRLCKNWLRIFIHKFSLYTFFFVRLDKIELRNGIKFRVNPALERAEISMVIDIWQDHVYDSEFSIKENDTVIDIGANKGYFTIYAASKAGKGHVYAFEPFPAYGKFIEDNARLNNLSNISIIKSAVWSDSNDREFYVSNNSGGHSMRPKPSTIAQVKVPAITLKEFSIKNAIPRIDFLKMDCEGSEYDIILNLDDETLGKISKIAMEYHDFWNYHHRQIANFLENHGFKVTVKGDYLYAIRS
jgi:FkbM family methyltransferase